MTGTNTEKDIIHKLMLFNNKNKGQVYLHIYEMNYHNRTIK